MSKKKGLRIYNASGAYLAPTQTGLQVGGWLGGYNYRLPITVKAGDATQQTDYQMMIKVYGGTGTSASGAPATAYCQNNLSSTAFSDVRFTTADGVTNVPYWIESSTTAAISASTATIWTNFPVVASSASSTTYYMYYGNEGASAPGTPLVMGKATFPLFDNFNNGTTLDAQWTSANTVAVASGKLVVGSATQSGTVYSNAVTFDVNYACRFNGKLPSSLGGYTINGFALNAWSKYAIWESNVNGANTVAPQQQDGTGTLNGTTRAVESDYSIFEVKRNSSTNVIYTYANGSAGDTLATKVPSGAMPIYFHSEHSTGDLTLYIDWVCVRKFTATEPTWSSIGTAQSNVYTSQVGNIKIQ